MQPLRRRLDAIAHYAALLLILLSLTPAFIGSGSIHLPGAEGRIAICTALGISYISAEDSQNPLPFKPQRSHCPLCIISGLGIATLPPAPSLEAPDGVAIAVIHAPESVVLQQPSDSNAQPRAPPKYFS